MAYRSIRERKSSNPAAVCGISNASSRLPSVRPTATEWLCVPTLTPTRSYRDWKVIMGCSFGKQDRWIILRSRLPAEPRSLAIGTIPVDPSDDAGDGGGTSNWVSPEVRTTDPNGHTPVHLTLAAVQRTRHLPSKENHRSRRWICGQLAVASSRTSSPHNNYGRSLQFRW